MLRARHFFFLTSILSWPSLLLVIRLFLFICWPYSFHVHPFHGDFIPRFSFSHYSTPYRHIFVCVLFVGRNYSASTRSTRISSRGLVAPTIQPPIVTYLHIAVPSVL